jgi:hypothetical protein
MLRMLLLASLLQAWLLGTHCPHMAAARSTYGGSMAAAGPPAAPAAVPAAAVAAFSTLSTLMAAAWQRLVHLSPLLPPLLLLAAAFSTPAA